MSDHHDKQASHQTNSFHNSANGITTLSPASDTPVLSHSAPSVLTKSRFVLFSHNLRGSYDAQLHPRRNYGVPHLDRM